MRAAGWGISAVGVAGLLAWSGSKQDAEAVKGGPKHSPTEQKAATERQARIDELSGGLTGTSIAAVGAGAIGMGVGGLVTFTSYKANKNTKPRDEQHANDAANRVTTNLHVRDQGKHAVTAQELLDRAQTELDVYEAAVKGRIEAGGGAADDVLSAFGSKAGPSEGISPIEQGELRRLRNLVEGHRVNAEIEKQNLRAISKDVSRQHKSVSHARILTPRAGMALGVGITALATVWTGWKLIQSAEITKLKVAGAIS